MRKREKVLSDDNILTKYYNFSYFSVRPMKITKDEKIKYERNCRELRGIVGLVRKSRMLTFRKAKEVAPKLA